MSLRLFAAFSVSSTAAVGQATHGVMPGANHMYDEVDDQGSNGLMMLQLQVKKTPPTNQPDTKSLFDEVKRKFERQYSPDGRKSQKKLSQSDVSLDFEIEPLCKLVPTPEVLLARGKLEITHSESESLVLAQMQEPTVPMFPTVSKHFEVGLDGSERGSPRRQVLQSNLEYGTVTMRPREALDSTVFGEMQAFTETMSNLKPGEKIPGGSAQVDRCWLERNMKAHEQNSTCFNNPLCCSHCGMQFTVGLELARVQELFQMSTSTQVVQVLEAVDHLCADEKCSAEYKGLVILGSWTLTHLNSWTSCSHPKRSMRPWLVRTHFGDMYQAVERLHGTAAMKNFKAHVLAASGMKASDVVLASGLVDYLGFPEMAETLGYVMSRDSAYSAQLNATQLMPVTVHGLKKVAQQMIDNFEETDQALLARPCGVWGINNDANNFTALDWLEGLEDSKDIMSDADSPISKNSFSGLVWKSMGSWRMDHQHHDSRVFLECRNIPECLSILTPPFDSPAEAGRLVALAMANFEDVAKFGTTHQKD